MARKKISSKVEAEVMFKSDRECCVCNKRGDHIHHIDGDNSNGKFENLAFLCFDCHNEASIKISLRKKLSAKTILKYRDHKYQAVSAKRSQALRVFDNPVKGLTTEQLLTISKNAIIILELGKIREEYSVAGQTERGDILVKLFKYTDHTNSRIAIEIYYFLSELASQTRGGMTQSVAISIFSLVIDFFPGSIEIRSKKKTIELSIQCINIGDSMIYDALIYLGDSTVASYGLLILKYIYRKGKSQKIQELIDKVNETYDELEQTLQRPERTDLEPALALIRKFRRDLDVGSITSPPL